MKYKATWSKKYHFPGCQNGKEEIQFQFIHPPPPSPLPFNSGGIIKMTPIPAEVFLEAEMIPLNLHERADEIFGVSCERIHDRIAWVRAIQHIGRLTVKKHFVNGKTIIVVTPFVLK